MNRALSILALAALTACGGGGGGSGGGFAVAPAQQEPAQAEQQPAVPAVEALKLDPFNPGCWIALDGHVECPLVAHDQPIGVGVPAGAYVKFTNNTGTLLQIDEVQAATGETSFWSEYCVYLGELVTGQPTAGRGEVGCSVKNIRENYAPITWGANTGLSVPPGGVIYLNSHTEPELKSHIYAMRVRVQTSGLHAWRQPQQDAVIPCDGQQGSTAPTPWRNDTDRDVHLVGVSIYSVSGTATPDTLNGTACIYAMTADGATKYRNCDEALLRKGEVSFPVVTIAPGEYVSAQAVNVCPAGGAWDWAAFLRVW